MTTQSGLRWWQRGVVYQIYPRSFKDSSGNGVGDIQGIIDHLDYLNDGTNNSLGIDAIWLSPFYPSPMADFGYDVSDYCDVHPMFGDLATFDRLVTEAHKRDIKIIIDYVPNHSSDQHAWFLESRSNRDNPKADWYIWRDAKPDGSLPNNWGSVFGGSAWEWVEERQQYYFHQFVPEQPDLNWRNPEVREAMLNVLRFWLERGIDGFRMDVIGMIMKHPDMPDQEFDPNADAKLSANDIYRRQIHIYDQDQDDVHTIVRDMRKLLDGYGDTIGIGEIWYDMPRWIKYYGNPQPDGINGDGLQLPFNFRLMNLPWNAKAFRQSVAEMETHIPKHGWPNYVLGNHDGDRLASRFGAEQARTAAMLLLTLRGTPTLYYGDELGIPNVPIPPEKVQDPQGINLGVEWTRDVCRTPMQWDSSPHAGFSTVEPWLPVTSDYQTRNVQTQRDDSTSLFNLYRKLLWLRKSSPALHSGAYRALTTNHDDCFVYLRQHEDDTRLVALNFSGENRDVQITNLTGEALVLSTYLDREEPINDQVIHLRPHEGVILTIQ